MSSESADKQEKEKLEKHITVKVPHAHKFILGYLALLVLAAMVAGVYHWQHIDVDKANKKAASLSSQVTKLKSQLTSLQTSLYKDNTEIQASQSAAQAKALDTPSDAVAVVQSAYDSALAYEQKNTGVSQAEIDTIQDDITSNLYEQLSADTENASYDPLLCGQALPSSVKAVAGTQSNGNGTVLVNEDFGSSNVQVTTTVDLGTQRISSIVCPQ
jgi:outer membrane murein-binding lipoprotein Lpp